MRSLLAKAGPLLLASCYPNQPPTTTTSPPAHSEVLLDGLFLPDSVAGGVTELLRGRGDLFTVLKLLSTNRIRISDDFFIRSLCSPSLSVSFGVD